MTGPQVAASGRIAFSRLVLNGETQMKTILRVLGLALGLVCGPALAQTYTVGVLEYGTRAGFEPLLAAFKEGLAENGFVEGRNLRFEYRYADADYRKVNRLGEDLVRAGSQVIFAPTTWSVHCFVP